MMIKHSRSSPLHTRHKAIPKNKTLVTIFEILGDPYIELAARTDVSSLICQGFRERKLAKVKEEIVNFKKRFVNIREIHFDLPVKDSWKFTYLITDQDQLIGTKAKIKERDKLQQRILLSHAAGFSISIGNVKHEKLKK